MREPIVLESFLPGRLTIEAGTAADYRALERFHYVGRRPATWAGVWVVRYAEAPTSAGRAASAALEPVGCASAHREPRAARTGPICRRNRCAEAHPTGHRAGRVTRGEAASAAGSSFTRSAAPDGRVVAVAVLSYPTVNSAARDAALGLHGWDARRRLAFVNRCVRTISRVVVHPQFRGVGLASRLVRHVCGAAGVRYVEAFAVMGRVHPFFEKGGMTRAAGSGERVVYYLWDGGRRDEE